MRSFRLHRPMNPNPRQAELLRRGARLGSASVEALAERFGVTLQTVRRDVKLLTEAGLLARFHGGVRVPSSTTENIAYRQRQQLNEAAKQRIARAVAKAVPNGCSLIINIGTTTEAIARELLQHRGLRVITNNLNVAAILSDNPDCEVIVAGGVVRARDRGIVGEVTVDFIAPVQGRHRADRHLGHRGRRHACATSTTARSRWRAPSSSSRAGLAGEPTTASSTGRRWSSWRASTSSTCCSPTPRRRRRFRRCSPRPACSASTCERRRP